MVYWQNVSSLKRKISYSLISLRAGALILLLYLVVNPWVQWTNNIVNSSNIAIYVDASQSMAKTLEQDGTKITTIKNEIEKWTDEHSVDVNWYLVGDSIREASFRSFNAFADSTTNFEYLPQHLLLNPSKQQLVITDGHITQGMNFSQLKIESDNLHILGVGMNTQPNDIWIENIDLPHSVHSSDSISYSIQLGYQLREASHSTLEFLDDNDNSLYNIDVSFPMGRGYIDVDGENIAQAFSGLHRINVKQIPNEKSIENNTEFPQIQIFNEFKKVLLISDGFSSNTKFLKRLLNDLQSSELIHAHRNNGNWNENLPALLATDEFELIVLDDFPHKTIDANIFSMLQQSRSELIYVEGPKSNATSAQLISEFYPFSIKVNDEIKSLVLKDPSKALGAIDISNIPPSSKQFLWLSEKCTPLLKFDDGSLAISTIENTTFIFIQDLNEISLAEKSNGKSSIERLLFDRIDILFEGEDNLVKLISTSRQFEENENFTIIIDRHKSVENVDVNIKLFEGNSIKEEYTVYGDENEYSMSISKDGDYKLKASTISPSKNHESKPLQITINKKTQEFDLLYENKNELRQFALLNDGNYTETHELQELLNTLNFRPETIAKEFKFSTLSTQSFWWIIIVLFSIEWFIRKREGLL